MIYEKDGIVYFKNGSQYEIANISTPYNETLVLVLCHLKWY